MILIDLSQIIISNILSPDIKNKKDVSQELITHMVLSSLKNYSGMFKSKYGEVVICCDSKNNWRKNEFKYYKANRKKDRDNSFIDWDMIYKSMEKIKEDLKENFIYKVLEVENAEADDVIATLSMYTKLPTVIVSSDKDYGQLQSNKNVTQFCPKKKMILEISNPAMHLKELVLRGDKSDGIPNFMSDDDTFVNPLKRQKTMKLEKVQQWLSEDIEKTMDKEIVETYKRNDKLINFKNIPKDLQVNIALEYKKPVNGSKEKMKNYFIANKMKQHYIDINKF